MVPNVVVFSTRTVKAYLRYVEPSELRKTRQWGRYRGPQPVPCEKSGLGHQMGTTSKNCHPEHSHAGPAVIHGMTGQAFCIAVLNGLREGINPSPTKKYVGVGLIPTRTHTPEKLLKWSVVNTFSMPFVNSN